MNTIRFGFTAAALATTTALTGCSRDYESTVSGMVTLNGQLLHRGTVVFHPLETGVIAYGQIGRDSGFVMKIGKGSDAPDAGGIMPGEYMVTVSAREPAAARTNEQGGPPDPGRLLTPVVYANVTTTPLRVRVKPGANVFALSLESQLPEDAGDTGDTGLLGDERTSADESMVTPEEPTEIQDVNTPGEGTGDALQAGAEGQLEEAPTDGEPTDGEPTDGEPDQEVPDGEEPERAATELPLPITVGPGGTA